jgi:hypothetical protein
MNYGLPPSDRGVKNSRAIRLLNIAQLVLTLLAVAAAAAVIGCEAHALSVYKSTRLNEGFLGYLPPLWPVGADLDVRVTEVVVVCGCVVVLVGILGVVVGVVPLVSRVSLFSRIRRRSWGGYDGRD